MKQENSFHGNYTRSSLISGKKVLCQVSSLKVESVSLVTVNPLEFNSMPNKPIAAVPSISDVDVSGSCFLNKIDLEEQDTQQRKNIKSNWNENEVLQLEFNFSLHYQIYFNFKGSSVFVGFESEGNCQIEDLRREISGLSQLASELYSVTQISDTDRVSMDRSGMTIWIKTQKTHKYSIDPSIHNRVLLRCGTNYEESKESDKSNSAARYAQGCFHRCA